MLTHNKSLVCDTSNRALADPDTIADADLVIGQSSTVKFFPNCPAKVVTAGMVFPMAIRLQN